MENEDITLELQEKIKQEEEVESNANESELKKAQDEAAKWRRIAEKKSKETSPISKDEFSLNDEVVDLRLDGYSKEDVNFIMKNGGRKTLEDKSSYVSIAINARREQTKAEAEANKIVDTSGMTEIERKYTPEMLQNMDLDELKKIVPKA